MNTNFCCHAFRDATITKVPSLRKDDHDVCFLIVDQLGSGATISKAISFCPFCGASIGIKDTHQLENILSKDGTFEIHFKHGEIFDLSNCTPIDFSIYHEKGGWSCTVDAFYSNDTQRQKFFRPGSGVDIHEEDIFKIVQKNTGSILYDTNTAEQDAAANP